jgi:hypothetical protein
MAAPIGWNHHVPRRVVDCVTNSAEITGHLTTPPRGPYTPSRWLDRVLTRHIATIVDRDTRRFAMGTASLQHNGRDPSRLSSCSSPPAAALHARLPLRAGVGHGRTRSLSICHGPTHATVAWLDRPDNSRRLMIEILVTSGTVALALCFLLPVLFACFSRGTVATRPPMHTPTTNGATTPQSAEHVDAIATTLARTSRPRSRGSRDSTSEYPVARLAANEDSAELTTPTQRAASDIQQILDERANNESGLPPRRGGGLVHSVAASQGVHLEDGPSHDTESLYQDHVVRMRDAEGGRSATGVNKLSTPAGSGTLADQESGLIDKSGGRHGVVSLTQEMPKRIDYRIPTPTATDSHAFVDVVGFYASAPDGSLVRDGTWTAWDKEQRICVVAVYRMGRLIENHVCVDGVKQRSMTLDDDLIREEGGLAHRHVMAAMGTASDAALRAIAQVNREARLSKHNHLRRQGRLSRQRAQEARQASAVDHQLHAVAHQQAARATAAFGTREVFPCVPSRGAYFFTPVNLMGSPTEYAAGRADTSHSSSNSAVTRHP